MVSSRASRWQERVSLPDPLGAHGGRFKRKPRLDRLLSAVARSSGRTGKKQSLASLERSCS